MNILPHKSWHVRTKKNIARVRRDEERAKKEEEELERRISLAEHEARIAHLKNKAGIKQSNVSTSKEEKFNLFEDFKDKIAEDLEKSSEKKLEQEKWEVKAGIFSYLDGRYKYDNKNDDEWYLKSQKERMTQTKDQDKDVKDERKKLQNDPLETMKSYLNVMRKNESNSVILSDLPKSNHKSKIQSTTNETSYSGSKSKKKKKKHKKHKRKNRSSYSSSSEDEQETNRKKLLIEKLRQERLDREKRERNRTMILLKGTSYAINQESKDIKQKYNSQFNPHIARQNMME